MRCVKYGVFTLLAQEPLSTLHEQGCSSALNVDTSCDNTLSEAELGTATPLTSTHKLLSNSQTQPPQRLCGSLPVLTLSMCAEDRLERVTNIMIIVLEWLQLPKHKASAVIEALDTWEDNHLEKFVAVYALLKRVCELSDQKLAKQRLEQLFATGCLD